MLPIGFKALKRDLEIYLVRRGEDEYLLHPRSDTSRPMTPAAVHNGLKRALQRAGLPNTIILCYREVAGLPPEIVGGRVPKLVDFSSAALLAVTDGRLPASDPRRP
jgi:hypothetical protein